MVLSSNRNEHVTRLHVTCYAHYLHPHLEIMSEGVFHVEVSTTWSPFGKLWKSVDVPAWFIIG